MLHLLRFQVGDELLTTNQEYNACRDALNYVAQREGLQVVVAEVPFPMEQYNYLATALVKLLCKESEIIDE